MTEEKKPTITDVYVRAKELLDVPGAWITNRVFNNDHRGKDLHAHAKDAGQYCAYGALWKAADELGVLPGNKHHELGFRRHPISDPLENAREAIDPGGKYVNAADMNNNHPDGLEAVKTMFCKAIDICLENEEHDRSK